MGIDLFGGGLDYEVVFNQSLPQVQGLQYIPNFIDSVEHDNLIKTINSQNWLTDLKRRVQHYGWKYDYKLRSIDYSHYLGTLPEWLLDLATRLNKLNYISTVPDQAIINEYIPGQGIASHIDCEPCFGDTIISLSLGSHAVMEFGNSSTKQKFDVLLEPKSLIVISGEARYKWTHGIPARQKDIFNLTPITRKTRISVTFRSVLVNSAKCL